MTEPRTIIIERDLWRGFRVHVSPPLVGDRPRCLAQYADALTHAQPLQKAEGLVFRDLAGEAG